MLRHNRPPAPAGLLVLAAWVLAGGAFGGTCGGGGSGPSTVGDATTLQEIYELRRLAQPEPPSGFQTWHVSTAAGGDYPLGDDANPGTPEAPLRSLDRVREVLSAGTCGTEIVFDGGEVWTGGDDLGNALYEIPLGCPNGPDGIAVYLRSSDPDLPAIFDCTGGYPFFGVVRGTAAGPAGWLVVENLHLESCPTDGFDTIGQAKMLTLNSGAVGCRGAGNQCFTPHNESTLVALNPYGEAVDGADAFVPAGDARFVIIGRGPFVQDDGGTALSASSGGGGFVLGTEFTSAAGSTSFTRLVDVGSVEAGDDHALTLLGAHLHGAAGTHGTALRLKATHADARVSLRLLATTIAESPHGIGQEISGDGAGMDLFGRCVLMDEISKNQWRSLGSQDVARSSVNLRRSLQDEDEPGTASFRINDDSEGSASTLAEALDQIATLDAAGTWTAFFDDVASHDSGGIGVDGIQWDGDDDPGTPGDHDPGHGCLPGKACWEGCGLLFEETPPVALPAFVLGRPITLWRIPAAHIGSL